MSTGRFAATALSVLLLAATFTGLAFTATAQDAASEEVVIAVLDSGIDPDHTEFTSCDEHPLVGWKDFVENKPEPFDPVGHGTSVASVAMGATVGEAPCAKILVARVCDNDGCSTADVRAAVTWAVEQGADVINLSLGVIVPSPRLLFNLDGELSAAREAGALPVVAAGNGAGNLGLVPYPSYLGQPSGSEFALVAGSSDESGNAAIGHSTDPEVVQAGLSVRSAKAGTTDEYTNPSGTSFAAPNVAGVAAAVQQAWVDTYEEKLSPDDLENFLKWTAEDGGGTPPVQEGWGFVDRLTSLEQVPEGMPEEPTCPGPGNIAGTVGPYSRCANLVHDQVANTVRDQW